MYGLEKNRREDTFHTSESKYPSFSSTLLDKIYRSIDEGDRKSSSEMWFYRETTCKKQSKSRTSGKCDGVVEEQDVARRASLLEKWVDKKVIAENVGTQWNTQTDKKMYHYQGRDNDALFFSSTSNSSDSSSGGLSSSDTESVYGLRSRASCFAPSRPKPVRTTKPEKPDKTRRHSIVSGAVQIHDGYTTHHNSSIASNEAGLIKSKSRALKIYNNLKKVKQPISPGGKLTNFLNSLLNTKRSSNKSASSSVIGGYEEGNAERKAKSRQASSTCSSASSFSRSCLSKTTSSSSREKMRSNENGVKRTVRFYPVSVIVGEDSRPCGHKCLYEEDTNIMAMSVPTAWKIGRSPPSSKKIPEEELKFPVMENNREYLKEYRRNHIKSDLVLRDVDEGEDEDDDAASYSSSDLFELDHLAVIGNNRYSEELPVYETTHFGTNRAIANGLRI